MVMENRRNMQFVRRCETCAAIADCKAAFGKFWIDKSHGGEGCNHPLRAAKAPQYPKMPRRQRKVTQQDII